MASKSATHLGPLSGVRVLDLTWFLVGPQATRILSAFGAEVILIERPDSWGGFRNAGANPSPNMSGLFNHGNTNKLGITLNVRHPSGYDILLRLIKKSDVVIENFSTGVLETWGLNYREMARVKPDIIYVSISGFGHTGPEAGYVAFAPTAQALSGLTLTSGMPGRPPAGWGFSYMDHTGGYFGAMAVLNALHYRNRTGKGQRIDLSMLETAITQTGPYVLDFQVNGRRTRRPDFPPGNRATYPRVAPHNVYRCAGHDRAGQDEWCAIACFSEDQWHALSRVMGQPQVADDPRFSTNLSRLEHQDELDATIGAWAASLGKYDVMYQLQARGVPAGAVQNGEDRVEKDSQLKARGLFIEMTHAELGPHLAETLPMHFSRSACQFERPSPLWGQHTEEVLKRLLEMSDSEIKGLRAEGVI